APPATAAPSVTSKISGVNSWPNSFDSLSASVCLRTLPKTWNPPPSNTLTQPQPIPVDAPVTTTAFIEWSFAKVPSELWLQRLAAVGRALSGVANRAPAQLIGLRNAAPCGGT